MYAHTTSFVLPPCVHMAAAVAMCVEVLKSWHVNCYALNRCSSVLFDRWHVSCQHVLEADTCDTCVTYQYKQGQPCVICHTCLSNWILYYGHLNVVSFHMFILARKGVSRWHFHAWYELCVSSFSFLTSTCEHFLSLSQADWAIHTTFIIFTLPQVIAEN